MKPYTIILFLCSGFLAKAQTNYLGLKAGYAYSLPKYDKDYKARQSFAAALTFEHKFKSKLTIGAELLYSQKGFTQNFAMGTNLEKESVSFKYNYLGIPLKVGYTGGDRFNYFVNAGFCTALLLSESRTHIGSSLANFKYDTRPLEFSAILELGIGYELTEKVTFNVILGVQQCLTPVGKANSIFSGDELTQRTDMILLGLKYKLGSQE